MADYNWEINDGNLPELDGFDRVAPTPLPAAFCKIYIGDNLITGMYEGNNIVERAYFREGLIWQEEVY